ncbi:MAG: hypothetical protein KFF73_20765 [Cyclobacteriaceae bacterium]|nr:hypothetical protein [Cyclobacteriaceae bacterium]
MKNKLLEIKQYINAELLPERWRLKTRMPKIVNSASDVYEFKIQIDGPEQKDLKSIRQLILLHPYVVSTHPVQISLHDQENRNTELTVSFTVLNREYGNEIENTIRSMSTDNGKSG